MPTPFLALNPVDGTTPQVRRYVTGEVSAVGVATGTLDAGGHNSNGNNYGQRVIRFGGHNTFIMLVGTEIRRSTDSGATWSPVFSSATIGSFKVKAGPYLSYVNGTARLSCVCREDSTTNWRILYSDDGITWTLTAAVVLTVFGGGNTITLGPAAFWRGSWYSFVFGTGTAVIWSPGNLTISSAGGSPAISTAWNYMPTVYNDRLFVAAYSVAGSAGRLYEFLGGTWVSVAVISPGTAGSSSDQHPTSFVDQVSDKLVTAWPESTGTWVVTTFDSILTQADIASAVSFGSVFGNPSVATRIDSMVDGPDPLDATQNRRIYLYVAPSGAAGTAMSMARWNGIATPPTSLGQGGSVSHAIPFGVKNGGSVFWTSGQRHIERVTAIPILGGVRLGFKLWSPYPTVDAVSVRFTKATAQQEYLGTPFATLTNPSVGSISGGNTITGLDAADNGVTTFTVDWMAETDGFSTGDFAKLVPRVFA